MSSFVFDPKILATDAGGVWQPAPAAGVAAIKGFSIDTRTLQAGELFVALTIGRRDGHEFVAAARAAGASGAIVARPAADAGFPQLVVPDTLLALHSIARAHRQRFAGRVVAVTGSAGKTSTKDLLAGLLGGARTTLATEGNLNNHLGAPLTLLRLDPKRHRFGVVEAGISAPGEMSVIAALIAPDVAMVTLVAAAHLDGLRDIAGVAAEKSVLAQHIRAGGVAIFPAACLRFDAFRQLPVRALVTVRHGAAVSELPANAEPIPYVVEHTAGATNLCVTWAGAVEAFGLRRVTTGMADNAVLAIAAALQLGVSADAIRARLPLWRPAHLRGEIRRSATQVIYLDCYNANPASMADALEGFVALAAESPAAARLYVVGSMEELGAEAAALHLAAGRRWPLRAGDRLVVFGTHARELATGAGEVAPGADVLINPDRAEVARLLREFRGAIFIKGSRRYALEDLLELEPRAALPGGASRTEVAA